jgi:Spy/CpxP family protein refolding chaperone
MEWLFARHQRLWTALFTSLAFNVGFGTTFGVRQYCAMCSDSSGGGCGMAPAVSLQEELGLTAEQETRLAASRARLRRDVGALRRELTAQQDQLAELLQAAAPDRAALAAQLDEISATQRTIQARVTDQLLEEKSLLTPSQRETFDGLLLDRVGGPAGDAEDEPAPAGRAMPAGGERGRGGCMRMGER